MPHFDDGLQRPAEPLFPSLARRRGSSRPPVGILALLLLLPAGAVVGWLWMRGRPAAEPADAPTASTASTPVPASAAPARGMLAVPPLDLPPLSESDAFVRQLVARLSAHPRFAAWFVTDELVHRFVVAVVRLAGGASPASELPSSMAPEGEFRALQSGGRLFLDPATYRRYDGMVAAFTSVDTEGAVTLYYQLHPLFEEEYRQLGVSNGTFDDMVVRATANLLAVRAPDRPLEVRPNRAVFEFVDPSLEANTEAAKHLIRMGPENARRFQAKLSKLAEGLRMGVQTAGP